MATARPKQTPSKETTSAEETKNSKLVVAAIDFGTTFTGFAFAFRSKPNEIFSSKWSGESVRSQTERAPTCVLLSPEKEFIAFGFEAEEKYTALLENDLEDGTENAKKHYFFERFKMKLYSAKKLERTTKIADISEKEMLAIDIFAKVISNLKELAEQTISQTAAGLQDDEIFWVITVPAIWSDSAKQFMREAASKAGINEDSLKLILEPEAASLFCNTQQICKIFKLDGSAAFEPLPEGQKYIVADLGGGTADMSVHEILEDRNLREIYRSDGDAYGGTLVDKEFFDFLENVFGASVMEELNKNHFAKVMEIRQEFETKKRNFKTGSSEVRIKIPKALLNEIIGKFEEGTIQGKLETAKEKYAGRISILGDKLCFGAEVMETFFKSATDGIIKFMSKMREQDEVGEINTLIMVGGFAESAYLREKVYHSLPGLRIIVPQDPSLAVLKGAVITGYNPKVVTERIARYTYGFSFGRKFKPGEDPEELKVIENGQEYCSSVFKKLITKGDVLKVGDHFGEVASHICEPENILKRIFPVVADLYKSEEKDPKYSEEQYGCKMSGAMLVMPPPTGWPVFSMIFQELVVGETEFTMRAYDIFSFRKFEGKLDFLR